MPQAACSANLTAIGMVMMSEQFQALPIDDQRAAAAYPLVYLYDASITTDQWLSFVRRHHQAAGEGGLIAIRDCRGIVHALFRYRVDRDLRVRKRLCITDLIVAHLPGVEIDAAVAASAERVSAELDCDTITIEQPFRPEGRPWSGCPTARWLRRSGPAGGNRSPL
jgi:hypothetical protein